eukprot:8092828-Pyramimonas_sp.AAC.1
METQPNSLSPPTHSPSIPKCLHTALYLDGNQQCSLTSLFRTTSSRRKHHIILVNRRYAGYVLKLSQRPRQHLGPIVPYALRRHYYDEGDLVDHHRPTTTKDDWGGWNGPLPVARKDPERGQAIIRVGNRDDQVQDGDAIQSLYIEALIAREIGSDNTALRT